MSAYSGGLLGARIALRPPVCRRGGCAGRAARDDGLCSDCGIDQDRRRRLLPLLRARERSEAIQWATRPGGRGPKRGGRKRPSRAKAAA